MNKKLTYLVKLMIDMNYVKGLYRTITVVIFVVLFAACVSMPSAPGSPQPPSLPKPPSPSGQPSSSDSQSESESDSQSESESESSSESESESESESSSESESESESSAIPPEWEEEADEGESAGEEGEVTFEEPAAGKEGEEGDEGDKGEEGEGFEETDFEEAGGMSQEELDELEKELNETLGDFDEQMQREQTYAEESANDNASEDALGGVGAFEDYNPEAEEESKQSKNQTASSNSNTSSSTNDGEKSENSQESQGGDAGAQKTEQKSNRQEQEVGTGVGGGQENDIPDGRDDDIVARQIREAAEHETDPVLREKLWEEYRKYKDE